MENKIIYLIIFVILYLFITQITIGLLSMIKNLIVREYKRKMRIKDQPLDVKNKSLLRRINESVSFILKEDKRKTINIPNKMLFIFLNIIGLSIGGFLIFQENNFAYLLLLLSFFFNILALGVTSSIRKQREIIATRIVEFKRDRMGLVTKGKRALNINSELQIMEWRPDYITPKRIRMTIPTNFDELRTQEFTEKFSTFFGKGSAWVPDKTDKEHPGWDFNNAVVSLSLSNPLPPRADWIADYVLNDQVAWSFFPLAIGAEGGIPFDNPQTGKTEHVIGFDVSGDQGKLTGKQGKQVGEELVMSPQILIAGGTGGGKSLSEETRIKVIFE